MQKQISEFTLLKKNSNETVIDYLTRATELQSNLEQANEGVSEKMLVLNILKGFPKHFETLSTIAKCSRNEKNLDELRRYLVNFGSVRQVIENVLAFNSGIEFLLDVINNNMCQNSAEKT